MPDLSPQDPGDDPLPRKAPVIPRIKRYGTETALSIEQVILPLVQEKRYEYIIIRGLPGSGKTTALSHLRAVMPKDWPVSYRETNTTQVGLPVERQLVVRAAHKYTPDVSAHMFELCPWTLDDCMEYLAAVHRPQCASVLTRLRDDPSLSSLDGLPELLVLVMDAMAADPSITMARQALVNHIDKILPAGPDRDNFVCATEINLNTEQDRWLRHQVIKQICRAYWIADQLSRGDVPDHLNKMYYADLVPEIAVAVQQKPSAIEYLERVIKDQRLSTATPMAASILLRVDPNWRPANGVEINLLKARLQNAHWSGIDLREANLTSVDFSGADLSGANLSMAIVDRANLAHANLENAFLNRTSLDLANLESANLTNVWAVQASLFQANLKGANLSHGKFESATLTATDLEEADCRWADFSKAVLTVMKCSLADFRSSNFTEARGNRVDMREARWAGASFFKVQLRDCNLEGLELPYANFEEAKLTGSLFTASIILGGNFRGALLDRTGLADIEWENADLRGADLNHASFHLGSTRSGLVGSTIPSEGSRTGFYTDDYNEQDYKSPEEIRKACLCGSNFLKAKVEGTDFYLVDLRRATYSKDQARHFARTGAILRSRQRE